MSEKQLQILAAAREKALEKKKQMRELTEKERLIKKKENELRAQEIEEKLKKLDAESSRAPVKPVKSKTKHSRRVVESLSSGSDSESSEDEEVVHASKLSSREKKIVKKAAKKTSKDLATEISKDELKHRIQQQALARAYNSLFGGY